MQKSKFLALLGILAVFMTMIGCPTQGEEKKEDASKPTDKFVGEWVSTYGDGFKLTSNNKYYHYNDASDDIAFNGTVVSTDESGDYLFLNLQISEVSRSPWGYAVSSYSRIALQSVSKKQCKMAAASITSGTWGQPDYVNDCTADTLENVKKKFTLETGAFSYFGDYTKK